jgi:hypothetical protein
MLAGVGAALPRAGDGDMPPGLLDPQLGIPELKILIGLSNKGKQPNAREWMTVVQGGHGRISSACVKEASNVRIRSRDNLSLNGIIANPAGPCCTISAGRPERA